MQIEKYMEILPLEDFPLLEKWVDSFCSFLFRRSLSFSPPNETSCLKDDRAVFPKFQVQRSCFKPRLQTEPLQLPARWVETPNFNLILELPLGCVTAPLRVVEVRKGFSVTEFPLWALSFWVPNQQLLLLTSSAQVIASSPNSTRKPCFLSQSLLPTSCTSSSSQVTSSRTSNPSCCPLGPSATSPPLC